MGSVKIGLPVSQHRPLPDVGGPEVAEHGEVLRAPGGTVVVVVTAIATGAAGGEDGADGADGVVLLLESLPAIGLSSGCGDVGAQRAAGAVFTWVVGDPWKGKCDMVFSPPGMLDRRSLLVTVSIIHFMLRFSLNR